jgi:ribosomal protein S18 acetylase RimI-like enzyme
VYGGHYPALGVEPTVRRPPLRFEDGAGRTIDVCRHGEAPVDDELAALVELYRGFPREDRTLGVPPVGEDRIRAWQGRLLVGHCVIAWHGDRAVGQAVLVPDGEGAHEFAVFVHGDYHGAGIGTRLTRAVLADGRDRGVERVWLLVEADNRPAVELYRDVGFLLTDRWGSELEMTLTTVPAA